MTDTRKNEQIRRARTTLRILRSKLETARDAEMAATVARLLAQKAVTEAIDELARLEKEVSL